MASPHMMLLLFITSALLAAAVRPATSWSPPPPSGTSPEPVLTFCSGQPPDSNSSSSSPAVDAVFREDEYTATVVFNATRHAPLPYRRGKAAVRRLLAAAASGTTSSHMCRGAGASRAAAVATFWLARVKTGEPCLSSAILRLT